MATISVDYVGTHKGFDIKRYTTHGYYGKFGDLIGGTWYEVRGIGTFESEIDARNAIDELLS